MGLLWTLRVFHGRSLKDKGLLTYGAFLVGASSHVGPTRAPWPILQVAYKCKLSPRDAQKGTLAISGVCPYGPHVGM